ncbi:F0F1 ATP synthase subunit B [Helicobacter valdiviensis]|uniref:ATP synthase subunit b n=1 Tax=Helicobacter valdiviensis TaxID=1458358 RepID=A0A2W6MWT3_9HELI|nr:F0F1 ATP synthase subunit B [Helicobacter valdiviensis]PZT47688.1 F0F1 ATP synthase subunit B [Helicobacter valdiviensis]
MKKILLFLLLAPCFVYAAGAGGEADIIERTINFVIFFALVYYFGADKIKVIFKERRDGIAQSLAKIEEKLQESNKEKQKALKQLEESKKMASDIIETAHKESAMIAQKIEENTKNEIENLIRHFNEEMSYERRKVEASVIEATLDKFLNKEAIILDKEVLGNALLKKVA